MENQSPLGLANPLTAFGIPAVFAVLMTLFASWVPVDSDSSQNPDRKYDGPSTNYDMPTSAGLVSLANDLWGDPFQNVSNAKKFFEAEAGPSTETKLVKLISNLVENNIASSPKQDTAPRYSEILKRLLKGNPKLLVMPVIVEGGFDQESVKDRLKYRHAIEHALAMAKFSMEFPERMSYCFVQNLRISKADSEIKHDSCVPIKLYVRKDEQDKRAILLCWIDRRLLGDKPLDVVQQIVREALEIEDENDIEVPLSVIGPKFSEELDKIQKNDVVECDNGNGIEQVFTPRNWVSSFRIYSPTATSVAPMSNISGLKITSTIGNDKDLIDKITAELLLRKRLKGQVVLFSEANALSSANFLSVLKRENKCDKNQFFILPYLKGFGTNNSLNEQANTADYLLRRIQSLSTREHSSDLSRVDVSAVGFLGNSVQDKLELIKVARRLFPNATFFTTDMYYEFLLPENTPFTRGLLVASHYRLSLPKAEDGQEQPKLKRLKPINFRDSYQASIYKAVTKATNDHFSLCSVEHSERNTDAFILEIGYSTVTDLGNQIKFRISKLISSILIVLVLALLLLLPVYPFSEKAVKFWNDLRQDGAKRWGHWFNNVFGRSISTFIPEFALACAAAFLVNRISFELSDGWVIAAILSSFVSLAFFLIPFFKLGEKAIYGISWIRVISCALLFCIFVYFCILRTAGVEEPFSYSSGTSIWPSLFFLVVMIASSIYWISSLGEDGLPWVIIPANFEKNLPIHAKPFDFLSESKQKSPVQFSGIIRLGAKGNFKRQDGGHKDPRFLRRMKLLNFSRIITLVVILCFVFLEFDWASFWSERNMNWGFIPTPPARGQLAISLGAFVHMLAILMVLHVSSIALAQLLALRRFIELLQKHLNGVNDPNSNKVQCLFKVCKELQSLTHQSSRGLWYASALVLLFAVGRLPFWDSWHLDYSTIMIVVVIPFLFSLPFAIHLRSEAASLRSLLLGKLTGWQMDFLSLDGTSDGGKEPVTQEQRQSILDQIDAARSGIKSLNRGAFGSIWQDPLLGSILMIATSVFSGPGKEIVQHLAGFVS